MYVPPALGTEDFTIIGKAPKAVAVATVVGPLYEAALMVLTPKCVPLVAVAKLIVPLLFVVAPVQVGAT
jgi:Mrp family chromosome partitioning ATPase